MFSFFRNLFILIFFSTHLFGANLDLTYEEKQWIKDNPKIKILVGTNFPPFSYFENNTYKGLTIDIIKRVEEISGLKFDIKGYSWGKSLEDFKNGKADVISNISYTKKRDAFTLFTEPYYEIPNFIFGLKDDKSYIDNNSLKDKNLAVSKGIFYIDNIKKFAKNVLEYDKTANKAIAVIEGEADYFISSYTTGLKAIRESSLSNLKVIDEFYGIKKEDLRFGVNPSKPLLHTILEKALAKISTQEITSLANKWIVFAQDNSNYKKIDFTEEEITYINSNPIIKYSEIDWMPLSIIQNNSMQGIMADYLKIISVRTGLKFEFVPSKSWYNVLEQFNEKKIDLVPSIGSSPQEKALGLVSNRYAKYPMVIISGPQFTYIESLDDLKDKVIAVPKYYTSYNFIKKNYPNIKLLETKDIPEALILVENGKADAFVGHIATSIFYISQLQLVDLKISGSTLFDFEHHYLIQKDNPILLSIINKTLDSITEKEKKDIYSNWIQTTVIEKTIDHKNLIVILMVSFIIIVAFAYRQYILKKYNNRLKQSFQDIQSIINSTMEAIIISENRICVDANDSALKLFNYKSKEEMKGLDFLDFISDNDKQAVRNSLLMDIIEPFELNILTSDNKIIPTLGRGTTLNLNGKSIRISSLIDLSEVKNKEKLLIEQSKMAALGEMIGHIAHQWRQPLSIITTITSSWSIYNEIGQFDKKRVLEDSKSILSNAKYLSQTIDDFRSFIKGEENLKEFDIKDLMENLNRLVSPLLHSVQVKLIFKNNISKVLKGSQNEMLQALINVVNNAVDALNQNVKGEEKLLFISILECQNCICIRIRDNAGGIPTSIMDKIFEPYFTTKHESKGTGLGLYMTYSIVKKLKGDIKVSNVEYEYENKKFKGANFLISLNTVS